MLAEIVALAQQLSGVSLATLLIFILISSYKGWWIWGSQFTAAKADWDQRYAKLETISDKWQAMALKATGLAEDSVGLAKKRDGS